MVDVEIASWWFVRKMWERIRKKPLPDAGFEESFRTHLYSEINFESRSDTRDTGLGLSYHTLSDTPHELDVICTKESNLFVFELKHYDVSEITKEIIFTFLGKVTDFYLKNLDSLRAQRITMFLVTSNRDVSDSTRKLCITYGVKLIEPSLMTLRTLDYFVRDLYQKIPETDTGFRSDIEELIRKTHKLREAYDYTFSDFVRYRNGEVVIVEDIASFFEYRVDF